MFSLKLSDMLMFSNSIHNIIPTCSNRCFRRTTCWSPCTRRPTSSRHRRSRTRRQATARDSAQPRSEGNERWLHYYGVTSLAPSCPSVSLSVCWLIGLSVFLLGWSVASVCHNLALVIFCVCTLLYVHYCSSAYLMSTVFCWIIVLYCSFTTTCLLLLF